MISFIGAGSMGSAIIRGAINSGYSPAEITATNRSRATSVDLAKELGINSFNLETDPQANIKAVKDSKMVVLGVKPYQILETIDEISEALSPGAVVVSVAGGITIDAMQEKLPGKAVFRAMPNTPSMIGMGVTGIAAGNHCDQQHIDAVVKLFESVGEVIECPEDQIDSLSTISGSGPAYVFYFIEQFEKIALEQGFSKQQAAVMVRQTFLGASELVVRGGSSPEELRSKVTSPNGTTEKAIEVFENKEVHQIFTEATQAALKRARQIAGLEG